MTKVCFKCKEELSVDRFHPKKKGDSTKLQSWCKGCLSVYAKRRWKEDPQYRRDITSRNYKRFYGVSFEQFEKYLVDQGGACRCCGTIEPYKWELDHCHTTGNIRGVLCNKCNTDIGRVGDSLEQLLSWVERVKQYLTLPPLKKEEEV